MNERARVWGSRGAAQCERRTRLRSSSVSSGSAQNGGCRAADTAISWDRKTIPWTGGPHRGSAKRASAAGASADRKRCGFRSAEDPPGAINEVYSRGQMRLHRGDVRRKTVAELTEDVVGRAPLQRRRGRSRSRDKKASSRLRLRRQSWSSESKVVVI